MFKKRFEFHDAEKFETLSCVTVLLRACPEESLVILRELLTCCGSLVHCTLVNWWALDSEVLNLKNMCVLATVPWLHKLAI